MMSTIPLAFSSPFVLWALVSLPFIWWILRVNPPAPRRAHFPAIRLLFGLVQEEETPAQTPLWLLLVRLALAALFILALADPVWRPDTQSVSERPLLIVVDDGWVAAPDWDRYVAVADRKLEKAYRTADTVALTGTTGQTGARSDIQFTTAEDARATLLAMQPAPLTPNRRRLADALVRLSPPKPDIDIIWISNGLDHGAAALLSQTLSDLAGAGTVTLIEPAPSNTTLLLPPVTGSPSLDVTLRRADTRIPLTGRVQAKANDGRILGLADWHFETGEDETSAAFDLPLELRNTIHHLQIEGTYSAGAVALLDERWKRRAVGMISGLALETDQTLLSDLFYLERALKPYADIRHSHGNDDVGGIEQLISQPLSVLVLADVGRLTDRDRMLLEKWVENGGFLIRFAGPRLAAQADDLIPVRLRSGGRALDGALSWTTPQRLDAFDAESPFFGLPIPQDVTITRQVLADPGTLTTAGTWARLTDGTPLVTAATRGKGRIVLFHSTANTDWTNLPLSGLYVEMLRRLIELSQGIASGVADAQRHFLSPQAVLNGNGQLISPPPWITAPPAARLDLGQANEELWPGFYGESGAARALNLGSRDLKMTPLGALPGLTTRTDFETTGNLFLKPALLISAFLLLLLDTFTALILAGHLMMRPHRTAVLIAGLSLFGVSPPADAAEATDLFAMHATRQTHLAYVVTGDDKTDEMSRAGLTGLTKVLSRRTSIEPGDPIGVTLGQDELAFFPLLYWPITGKEAELSDEAIQQISNFMKRGGTIFFDTKDHERAFAGVTTQNTAALRRVVGMLDIPPLEPVSVDHVLTKSFYLLQSFPGRWDGGQVWVESASTGASRSSSESNDGVSAIIIGANDFAGAWAIGENGRPLLPVAPGGERQREFSYRFGVNLVMYALTGNYKADQVHVPALLERLGQ